MKETKAYTDGTKVTVRAIAEGEWFCVISDERGHGQHSMFVNGQPTAAAAADVAHGAWLQNDEWQREYRQSR